MNLIYYIERNIAGLEYIFLGLLTDLQYLDTDATRWIWTTTWEVSCFRWQPFLCRSSRARLWRTPQIIVFQIQKFNSDSHGQDFCQESNYGLSIKILCVWGGVCVREHEVVYVVECMTAHIVFTLKSCIMKLKPPELNRNRAQNFQQASSQLTPSEPQAHSAHPSTRSRADPSAPAVLKARYDSRAALTVRRFNTVGTVAAYGGVIATRIMCLRL